MLRGALIGCGYIAKRHVRAWSAVAGAELIAVCDRDRARADGMARLAGGVRVFESVEAMMDELGPEFDFVDVCVPPEGHRAIVDRAVARGIGVLCQKPLAATAEDSLAIAELVAGSDVTFAVNEMWKWIPAYEHVWQMLRDGAAGRVESLTFVGASNLLLPRREGHSFAGLDDKPSADNQHALLERFGAMRELIVLEYGVHVLDMIREWFGDPRRLRARLSRTSLDLVGDDSAWIELDYDSFTADITLDWCRPGPETFDNVDGESLALRSSEGLLTAFAGKWVEWHPRSGPVERRSFDVDTRDAGFARSHQEFADALMGRAEPTSDVVSSLKSQGLVVSCYDSARRGGEWIAQPSNRLRYPS